MSYEVELYICENCCLFINKTIPEYRMTDFKTIACGNYIETDNNIILKQAGTTEKITFFKEVDCLVGSEGLVWTLSVNREFNEKMLKNFEDFSLKKL